MEERNPKTNIRQFTEALANIEHVEHGDAWKKFFLDVDLVKDVSLALTSDVSAQMAVIAAGGLWQGGGWNSSQASKRLYSLTGVPVVSSDFSVSSCQARQTRRQTRPAFEASSSSLIRSQQLKPKSKPEAEA